MSMGDTPADCSGVIPRTAGMKGGKGKVGAVGGERELG